MDIYESVHSQHQCEFFNVPTEIRRAIYTHLFSRPVHLTLHNKRMKLTACVQRDGDGDPTCSVREYKPSEFPKDCVKAQNIYARRVQSSWGPHWRCEEFALGKYDSNDDLNSEGAGMQLLRVCKRMFIDILAMIVDAAAVEVNSLEALSIFTRYSRLRKSDPSNCNDIMYHGLSDLKELRINTRLPISIFETLQGSMEAKSSSSEQSVSVWTNLPDAIRRMTKLRRLRIWLDHTDTAKWTRVNERIIVAPFESLSIDTHLDIRIVLPNLHPRYESPDRHFTEDSESAKVDIQRMHRQIYHAVEQYDGSLAVEQAADFPTTYQTHLELAAFADHPDDQEPNRFAEVNVKQLEASERAEWKRGRDPYKTLQDAFELSPCGLYYI